MKRISLQLCRRALCLSIAVASLMAVASPRTALADAAEADLQVKILLRALAYDRNLKSRVGDTVTVAVLFRRGEGAASKEEILKAFSSLAKLTFQGLPMTVVEHEFVGIEHLREDVAARGIDVFYLCAGLDGQLPAILTLARSNKIATLTGEIDYVPSGVAIGVVLKDRAPKLWVNLTSSKDQGLNLSAELMRVAEVIR